MRKSKEKRNVYKGKQGGMYRGLTVSVKLLDAVIIGGLLLTAFIILASI